MNINSAFPSEYLKAADLQNKRLAVTIDSVEIQKIGEDQRPVVRFVGKDKGLVLNKTNANMIIEITGSEETEDWHGHRIVLYVAKVDYQGKRVPAIRVDYMPNGKPAPEPVVEDVDDSDIPF